MSPAAYAKAARRLQALAARVQATAGAQTVRERQARTRAVNALAQEARRLFERNAGLRVAPSAVWCGTCQQQERSGASTSDS